MHVGNLIRQLSANKPAGSLRPYVCAPNTECVQHWGSWQQSLRISAFCGQLYLGVQENLAEMVQQSCVTCLKNTMTFLNFLCWLCGAFVLAFGIFMMMNSRFSSLITSFWPIFPANTLVVTGTIVTCVCYLGFLGAMRENRCMLISFFILLFILMLVEIAMACVFLVFRREIDSFFEKDLMHSLETYKQSSDIGNVTLKDDFDAVQSIFRCCGVRGVSDWEGHVPISCCTTDPCVSYPQESWQQGCLMPLRNWFARNFLSTGAGVVTMFIIQFLCLCFTVPCSVTSVGWGWDTSELDFHAVFLKLLPAANHRSASSGQLRTSVFKWNETLKKTLCSNH